MADDKGSKSKNTLSFWRKTAFGVGGAAENLMQNGINNMANQVFNIFLGVNPMLISIAIFAARLWDAFTDPTMGSISDNTRGRFGRRRPYMLVGGILATIMFVLLWRVPPEWSEKGHFLWFLFGSILFYTFYTVFSVPCQALIYELSPDSNERTRIVAFRTVFAACSGIAIQWMFRLTQMDCFENTLDGMRVVSLGAAVIILIGTVVPALTAKERLAGVVSHQDKVSLWSSLKVTLRNRNFMKLVISVICVSLGLFMVGQLGLYVNIYYVFGGEEKAASTMLGFAGMIYHLVGGILAAPIISIVSARIGKKKTMMGGLTLALIGTLTKFVTYSPQWPWMQVVSLVLMSPGLSCLWVLTPSVVADICDEDEFNTGVRREGMYSAVYTNMMKIGVSIGLLFVGFILNASGFDAALGADQTEGSLMFMRVCFTAIPSVGLILGMSIISRIPMSAKRADEVRAELDARHEESAASE